MHPGIVISLLVLMFTSLTQTVSATTLNVACRLGQAPMNDAGGVDGTCAGLMYEIFVEAAKRANITYSMTLLDESDIDRFLVVNKTTNTSMYDLIISFHTVTKERMLMYDFTVALLTSEDCTGLRSQYRTHQDDLADSIEKASLLYILSIMFGFIIVLSFVIYVFERRIPHSEIHKVEEWRRFLWSFEQSFESFMSWSTSCVLTSQVSRSFRIIVVVAGVFLYFAFTAIITANMTLTGEIEPPVYMNPKMFKINISKIAIASSTLTEYFTHRMRTQVVHVPDINKFAARFYAGHEETDFDGYSTSCEVVAYLHNTYKGAQRGFVVSHGFQPSGVLSMKSFPYSKAAPQDEMSRLNLAIQAIREEGDLFVLMDKFIQKPLPPKNELNVSNGNEEVMYVIGSILFGVLIIVSILMHCAGKYQFRRGGVRAKVSAAITSKVANESSRETSTYYSHVMTGTRQHPQRTFTWKGRRYIADYSKKHAEMVMLLDFVLSRLNNKPETAETLMESEFEVPLPQSTTDGGVAGKALPPFNPLKALEPKKDEGDADTVQFADGTMAPCSPLASSTQEHFPTIARADLGNFSNTLYDL
eukprot:PhF_6_TR34956/c0_g1_i6/m.50724